LPDEERVAILDSLRGTAVLGILIMNAVSYGLPPAAYFNLSAGGSRSWLDWVSGAVGEVLVDQKIMGLFSMLFGAGIALFADRAVGRTEHPLRLSLWRNTLLLIIGVGHSLIWEGDVLIVYALCAPLVIWLRNVRPRRLIVSGTCLMMSPVILAVLVMPRVPADGEGLGEFWLTDGSAMSDAVGAFLLSDFFARALGMMLIGIALFRLGILRGARSAEWYRRLAMWGLGIGLPIAIAGLVTQIAFDFAPRIAVIGEAPITIATIPITIGYLALITLWDQRSRTGLHERVRAVGRMALTNYLTQTLLGVFALRAITKPDALSRTGVTAFVLVVWTMQLTWSKPWLDRFRYGPAEWLWRCATYRRRERLRRAPLLVEC